MLDLLLEAHELSLPAPNRPNAPVKLDENTRLLDVLEEREAYLPVTTRSSFFAFKARVDIGCRYGIESYGYTLEQLVGSRDRYGYEGLRFQSHMLDLVDRALGRASR